jgi:two-component system cell cycle response regulator
MVGASEILNAHILVVDDVEDNVMLLEQLLHGAGYTSVSSTREPRTVFELQRRHRFSLILLDLQMPGMDGFQVLDQLKQIEADDYVPVLVITAQPMHKLRALRDGARDFISKPFDPRELLIRIHNMLEVRLLHEAARDHGRTLESLALTDPLTGLANRRLLVDRLSMGLVQARRERAPIALLYLDLDGFKNINNTMGHAAGDELLKMVAGRLHATVREQDTLARLGGDEFVIVLGQAGADEAAQVADKVIEAVSRPYTIDRQPAHVTVSVGIGLYPAHGDDAEALMKSADQALYDAKRAGKNAFRIAGGSGTEPRQSDPE